MNKDTFERAVNLDERIKHFDYMIGKLNKSYELKPPTRCSGVILHISGFGNDDSILLHEEDVLCIREAFKSYRDKLNAEFCML